MAADERDDQEFTDELELEELEPTLEEGASSPEDVPVLDEEAEALERVPTVRLALVVGAPVLAAAVMTGGVFLGPAPRIWAAITGILGVALGVRASMIRRPGLLYSAILGGIFCIGLIAVVPTGFGNVVDLGTKMREAILQGDVLRPPVEFAPGWRAILGWIMGSLGFVAAWIAIEMRKPALGLVVSLPVVGIGAISVPESQQLASGLVALVLFVVGLALLSNAQTGGEDDEGVSLAFEVRRAVRALPLIAAVTVGLFFAARSNFLFPPPLYDPAQEAKKPKTIPLDEVEDRVLFTVDAPFTGPWKMGSLDVYDGQDWRLPPFAESELNEVPESGVVNQELGEEFQDSSVRAKFTVQGLGGAILPTIPNTWGIAATLAGGQKLSFDERIGNIRISQGQIEPGLEYEVLAAEVPQIEDLRDAPAEVPEDVEPFLEVPPPPQAVNALLARAPQDSLWDTLDFARQELLNTVVASGAGTPVSVPPDKVQDLLAGSGQGTPYEIVASQALIARWAGVPSRIGYGFDGGDERGGVLEIRPKHGAVYLEVFFTGFGWLPIIGDPLQAQESFSDSQQQFNPQVLASEDVGVRLFIPIATPPEGDLGAEILRTIGTLAPIVAVLMLIYYLWPLPYKGYRRARRRTWARERGPEARIAVAYAEWRDLCTDFGYRHYTDTPLMFLERVVGDEEHEELAWLTTRVLWGDLEPRMDEALAAEELTSSLRRRLGQAHAATFRFVAALSRLSVRHPYAPDLGMRREEAPKEKPREPTKEEMARATV